MNELHVGRFLVSFVFVYSRLILPASTLVLLPLITVLDETKAIADNKITVVILFLVLSIFVIANATVYVLKNTFSNCYPHLIQIFDIKQTQKMEYLHIHSCPFNKELWLGISHILNDLNNRMLSCW
jgi:4-amino-4-deoxy-L-arabinose transferase-like glycosyltransferase